LFRSGVRVDSAKAGVESESKISGSVHLLVVKEARNNLGSKA